MPPTTIKSEEEIQKPPRSEEEIMLDILLVMITGFPPDSEAKQALTHAGVRSIVDIFTLEDNLIGQLTYHDGTERVSLRPLDISKLRKIGPFHEALCDRENVYSLTNYMWSNVEPDDWHEYCVNPKSFGGSPKLPATTRAAATTLRDTFAKSIKKDPEAYPSFKEAQFWDAWNRELHSKAHLHDLKNVLDYSYLPAMPEENELFERFMYSVFLSKITVADGAHIVKSIPDAQECYEALVQRFSHSLEATMTPIRSERKSML